MTTVEAVKILTDLRKVIDLASEALSQRERQVAKWIEDGYVDWR